MIGFRQTDARYPFLWEGPGQPAGRWHAAGEGPAHYFADTPHGAWAEFLRHEEITDPADLDTIRRQIWAVELGDAPPTRVTLPTDIVTGGVESHGRCQVEARRLRASGVQRLVAPSAALLPGRAAGMLVDNGVHFSSAQDGEVIVLFGPPRRLVGWMVADATRPAEILLDAVRHFGD